MDLAVFDSRDPELCYRQAATRIRASDNSLKLLKGWRDFISRETNSADVKFVREAVTDGYIVEASLGTENFLVSVKTVEA
jgi:hypothetical protein